MCGEIDDEGSAKSGAEAELLQRFLLRGGALLARRVADDGMAGDGMNAYLDALFADVIKRCVDDVQSATGADAARRLALQSVVLARAAGFLAGHAALNDDPLRRVIEATMLGYGEADPAPRQVGDEHRHSH